MVDYKTNLREKRPNPLNDYRRNREEKFFLKQKLMKFTVISNFFVFFGKSCVEFC